jgi:hypothetical protein
LHLSAAIDYHESLNACLDLVREFTNQDAYFDLKSFTYFPRSFRKGDFERILAANPTASWPFSIRPTQSRAG